MTVIWIIAGVSTAVSTIVLMSALRTSSQADQAASSRLTAREEDPTVGGCGQVRSLPTTPGRATGPPPSQQTDRQERHEMTIERTPPIDGAGMNGADLIVAERQRQIAAEGWTPEHDDEHVDHELPFAAQCYVRMAIYQSGNGFDESTITPGWPWDTSWWKPSDDPIRNLVKAGALIAAEIDRLQRAGAL